MASYPSSAVSFSARAAGQTIASAHINALQDEVTAIETALLNGVQHAWKPNVTDTYDLGGSSERWQDLYLSGLIDSSKTGVHLLSGSGAGAVSLRARNSAAGTGNKGSLEVGNDTASDLGQLEALASTYTTSGPRVANTVALIANGAGGLALAAVDASGTIKFYPGGTTVRTTLSATRLQTTFADGGVWLQNTTSNLVECHIRAASGKKGYLTLTEDSVADRWSLGIENGDSALYVRQGAYNGTVAAKVASTGSWGFPLQPRVLCYKSGNQTITDGAGFTSLSFDSEVYDVGGLHDTSTNSQRITIVEDGVYQFGATVVWAAEAGGTRSAQFQKNGSTILAYSDLQSPEAQALTQVVLSPPVALVATDYVQLNVALVNAGANVAVVGAATFTQFWARRVA